MSWQASAWARGRKTGSPAKKAVLLCLAESCDQWGWTWTGELMIADDAELSDRHVRNLVKDLADLGLITIFQGRAAQGARRNLYRLNFIPRPKDPMPDEHPSLSERYKHHAGTESLDEVVTNLGGCQDKPPEKISGGATGRDFRSPPEESSVATGNLTQSDRNPSSGEPYINDKNRESRAREADDPDGSASPAAPEDQASNEPVNTHWKARQGDLAKALLPNQLIWLRDCIPHEDDGETLILAVPDRWTGEQIDQRIGRLSLQGIVGRQIKFLATPYAKAARQSRRGKAAQGP